MEAQLFDSHRKTADKRLRRTKIVAALAAAGLIAGAAFATPDNVAPAAGAIGVTYNKFQTFIRDVFRKIIDIRAAGDTFNIYLSNATPSASLDAVKADLAEIATGNGYTGPQDMQQDESYATGTTSMTAVDITITASGGTIGPFQYVVAYDDTPISPADPLMAWWDYGSPLTLNDGESFTVDFGATVFSAS